MKKIEILSPVGSEESVLPAVNSGADAIYLGIEKFSARANAKNFSLETLEETIKYCHIRNVKVYLAMNTILFDNELEEAVLLLIKAAKMNIDAIIVQDIGFASIIKKILPNLPLHASTQMSVHSPAGAKLLYEMGFSRVVLARELNKNEIAEIVESCPIETEVFVHGALCYSVSGKCYFSAMLGGRSGNRGQCAQPCRLPFRVSGGNGFALSLKDNSLLDHFKELEKIGVTSAKIEGRMKRPEYVAAATRAFYEKRDLENIDYSTFDNLNKIFSRTGFTNGYFLGNIDKKMFGKREYDDVITANKELFSNIKQAYAAKKNFAKLSFEVTARLGKPLNLKCSDGINTAYVKSDFLCSEAKNLPLTNEIVSAQLVKLGGTPYEVENIICNIDENVSVPLSKINQLRRQAIEKIDFFRNVPKNYIINSFNIEEYLPKSKRSKPEKQKIIGYFKNGKLPKNPHEFDLIFLPLFAPKKSFEDLKNEGVAVGVEIPTYLFGNENKIKKRLAELKQELEINEASAGSLDAVYVAKELGFFIHGAYTLNLSNTAAILWAEKYSFKSVQVSPEMTIRQIKDLGGKLPKGAVFYGYLPLMASRTCPLKNGNANCISCNSATKLQDRMKKSFNIFCCNNYIEVLNNVPLIAPETLNFCNSISNKILIFYVENYVETVDNLLNSAMFSSVENNFTHGLYKRGIK